MAIKQVDPEEAYAALQAESRAIYLDVRTTEEFQAGHPQGALNVPIFVRSASGFSPNKDFVTVVEKAIPDKDRPIFCGCQVGGRSQQAAELLSRQGYTVLANVAGGYGGAAGRKGWSACGLPITSVPADGASYAALRDKAGL
jgi:rhodanese-related sulfurtransferase